MTAAQELAEARRELGVSLQEISLRTKISADRLSAVERASPSELPSLLHLKDLVRAYAVAVQLDPDTVWVRYMSELPDPVALTSLDQSRDIVPSGRDVLPSSEHAQADLMWRQSVSDQIEIARRAEWRVAADSERHRSRRLLPLGLLAATLASAGAYLLSVNMHRRAADSDAVRAPGLPRESRPASSPSAATSPQPSVSPAPNTETKRMPPEPPPSDTRPPRAPVDERSRTAAVPAAVPEPATMTAGGTRESTNAVTGAWNLTSKVESATVAAYENLMLGFRLELEQRGNHVVGEGRKVSENGAALPARLRTPITVEGTMDGNLLSLNFTETGARRKSAGRFLLYREDDGSFRGRFRSDAAQSSGETVAVREAASR